MQTKFNYIIRLVAMLGLVISIGCALAGFKASGYTITGSITGGDSTLFYLSYDYAGKKNVTVAELKLNGIVFKGHLPEPVICTLSNSRNRQIKVFVAENADIKFEGTLDKMYALQVKNSREDSLYDEFKAQYGKFAGNYRIEIKKTGADLHDQSSKPYLNFHKRLDSLATAFVTANSGSTAAALAIIDTYINNPDKEKAAACYKLLSVAGQRTIYAKRVLQFAETATTISPGHAAPKFTLADSNGKMVKLSDFKGKYVFLDFWASWCVPCRKTHPLLRQLHEKYGVDSNIVFVGLSMDASVASWKQAIATDQLSWLQLNDPKSTNGSVADAYGVKSIPFNCVVNPKGIIVATNLHDMDLENCLLSIIHQHHKE